MPALDHGETAALHRLLERLTRTQLSILHFALLEAVQETDPQKQAECLVAVFPLLEQSGVLHYGS